ncbi:MAG: prephenate dehydrogenase [Chitinophagaceae bacterium]|nr:prephenate dehydrogenase [Chitinophagaceae bacterium]
MIVTVVGVGLIGGSMAIALKEHGIAKKVIGVDASKNHLNEAKQLGLIDESGTLSYAIKKSDLIVVAIPVDAATKVIPRILDRVTTQVVMDVGSTKRQILEAIADHPKRSRFVGSHPMWGTEYSGPKAAQKGAFKGKVTVISDRDKSDSDAIEMVENIYRAFEMKIVYMDATDHDLHTAYISHISHITSFALANTVLEKEKEKNAIFDLASAGFESTVRLAKSNPTMWLQIFMQNRENILDVLKEHISQLKKFETYIKKGDEKELKHLMEQANKIRKILK